MTPVVFNKCFGWLHDASGNTGVVLCNAYGHEALWAHRGWRGLAEQFAKSDMPTLRFDYRGTGDSAESEDQGERIEAWIDSVVDAVQFLRDTTKVRRVVLCGVRLGGFVAALAAERIKDIDGLILLAPVVSGREYVRELKLIQRRWRNTAAANIAVETPASVYIETIGFRLNTETSARLEAANLIRDGVPCTPRVLILDPVKVAAADVLRDHFAATGAQVDVTEFPDYAHLLNEATAGRPPEQLYAQLPAWVQSLQSDAPAIGIDTNERSLSPTSGPALSPMVLEDEDFVEVPVIFGDGRLFGVYCRPSNKVLAATPVAIAASDDDNDRSALAAALSGMGSDVSQQAVLFVNTAANHHIGEARMWVTHARKLARQGVASLRMDVGLLGDSATAVACLKTADFYLPQSVKDASLGIDWLVDAGHSRPTIVGICSGAYLGLNAAVQNERLSGAVLINQRDYFWVEGHTIQAPAVAVASQKVYMRSMRSAEKWQRLMRGQVPVASIVGGLLSRKLRHVKAQAAYLTGALRGVDSAKNTVRKQFATLQKRGVNVRVVYGEYDEGIENCEAFLGKNFAWVKRLSMIKGSRESTFDHALFLYPARVAMMKLVDQSLIEQAQQAKQAVLGVSSGFPMQSTRSSREASASATPQSLGIHTDATAA